MTPTILSQLRQQAIQQGDAVAMAEEAGGTWQTITWQAFDSTVELAGRALIALGIEAGGSVGILGFNRPRWTFSCLATSGIGATPAGIYQTCSASQVAYILQHASCAVVIVEDVEQWLKVESHWDDLDDLKVGVLMTDPPADFDRGSRPQLLTWDEFLARGEDIPRERFEARRQAIEASTPATLIYTSGTTGRPKAVVLSHDNLMQTGRLGAALHGLGSGDRVISYLPLAHIAEQMISVHISVYVGFAVYYLRSPEQLAETLRRVRPVLFFGVPRVWERIYDALQAGLAKAPVWRQRLARWAFDRGWRVAEAQLAGREVGSWQRWQHALADRLVLAKVRRRLGFDALRIGACGAAPVRQQILQFFFSLGVPIYEVYGLSETCGPTTWNAAGSTRLGTVGPPLPEVAVKIADDGEVLIQGPNVFQGYLNDPAATAEAIDGDGWFHSGDLGFLDDAGYLVINGRKKDLLITSGGKNIAPSGIESHLKQIPEVQEAIVIGDGRRYLTALLSLIPEASGPEVSGSASSTSPLQERLQTAVNEVNQRHARVEAIRDFRILPRPLSLEEGELTPTLKVKRHVVQDHFATLIEEMYPGG